MNNQKSDYIEFLEKKRTELPSTGFECKQINKILFDFQKDIVRWAVRQGRAAIFADCGLGKTFMQLEWSRHVYQRINKPILILAPLAVSKQTKLEAKKIDIEVNICNNQNDIINGINITNYEKIDKFNFNLFGGIVLDESSILKSYSGKYKQEIINKSKDIIYKLACTATPSPNDHMEILNHSELFFLHRT